MKRIFKNILIFAFLCIMLCCVSLAKNDITLMVDGERIECTPSPVIINDRVLIPARAVFENMGASVEWSEAKQMVMISYKTTTIKMVIGNALAVVDGEPTVMDSPAQIIADRTMIPLRFVGEAIGSVVGWNDDTRTVSVASPGMPNPTPTPNPTPAPTPTLEPTPAPNPTAAPTTPTANVTVSDIGFNVGKTYDTITATASGKTRVSVLRLENPDRLVFDIKNAKADKRTQTIADLSGCAVSEVRCASHSDGYVRIAVDVLAPETKYAYIDYDGKVEIRIYSLQLPLSYIGGEVSNIYLDSKAKPSLETITDDGTYIFDVSGVELNSYREKIGDDKIDRIEASDGRLFVYTTGKELSCRINGGTITFEKSQKQDEEKDTEIIKPGEQIVVLDAGHGGNDPGAIGYDENGEIALLEKTVNLAIMLKVRDVLKESGVNVLVTRDRDEFLELSAIAAFANDNNATLFVSVHNNAIEDKASAEKVSGSMVLYSKSSTGGKMLASNILSAMTASAGTIDRGLIDGSGMAVIRLTAMPAVIVECGFVTNPTERQNLMNEEFQQRIAEGIAQGILKTLKEI